MLTEEAKGKGSSVWFGHEESTEFRPFLKQRLEKIGGSKCEQLEVHLPYLETESLKDLGVQVVNPLVCFQY